MPLTPAQHHAIDHDLATIEHYAPGLPIDTTRWTQPGPHTHTTNPAHQTPNDLNALTDAITIAFLHGRMRAWQWTLADHPNWTIPPHLEHANDTQLDTLHALASLIRTNLTLLPLRGGIEWKAEEIHNAATALERQARAGRLTNAPQHAR